MATDFFGKVLQKHVKTYGATNKKNQCWYKCKYSLKRLHLSPGIDDSSTMPKFTTSMTPKRITPKKKELPEIRK